jgi:hypothetical protein
MKPRRELCLVLVLLGLLGAARVQSALANALGADPGEQAYDNPLTIDLADVGGLISAPVVYTDAMGDQRSSIVRTLLVSGLVTLPAVGRPGTPFRLSDLTRAPPSR